MATRRSQKGISKSDAMADLLKQAALAAKSLDRDKRREAFTWQDLNSRPTEQQLDILRGIAEYPIRIVRAGNQCLVGSTMVATPGGPVPIKDVKVGDTVYDEHGKEIKVLKVFANGKKEVIDLISYHFNKVLVSCTPDHVFLVNTNDTQPHAQLSVSNFPSKVTEICSWDYADTDDIQGGYYTPVIVSDVNKRIEDTYDIHVDSPTNLYVLASGLITHNSGKSRTCGRDLTWFVNREHPHIDVTATYGSGPLLTLVCGQDTTIMTQMMWKLIIKPLLTNPSDWNAPGEDSSNGVKVATNTRTGDTIIFISHNHAKPDDIKHMQGYDAHYVWIDEMPKDPAVIEELTRRIDAKRGRLVMSFTQKVRNVAIQRSIDKMDVSIAHTYRLHKLDNPLYADRKDEELKKISHLSADLQRAILEGDWIESSNKVFMVNPAVVFCPLPTRYSKRLWPHVLSVDPATESKLGMVVMAGDPETGKWYVIRSSYVHGLYVPTLIIRAVEEQVRDYNIVRRIYDTAAPWYAHQARELGYLYSPVPDKSGNKSNWIASLQEALGQQLFIVKDGPGNIDLQDEIESYERSDKNYDVIKNPHKFHLIDSLNYGWQMKPPIEQPVRYNDYWEAFHASLREQADRHAAEVRRNTHAITPLPSRKGRGMIGGSPFRSWRR